MTDLPDLRLTEKQRRDLKTLLYRLNWVKILNEAVEMRSSSWNKNPVFEWRNASDCVNAALVIALEHAGVLLSFREEILK